MLNCEAAPRCEAVREAILGEYSAAKPPVETCVKSSQDRAVAGLLLFFIILSGDHEGPASSDRLIPQRGAGV